LQSQANFWHCQEQTEPDKKVEDIQSIVMKNAMILRAKPDKKIESRHSNADKNTNCVN